MNIWIDSVEVGQVRLSSGTGFVLALVFGALLMLAGCGRHGDELSFGSLPMAPANPVDTRTGEASVRMSFCLTPDVTDGIVAPSIRGEAGTQPQVGVTFVVFHPGDETTPVTYLTASATPDANNRVTLDMTLPALPTVAKIQIASGAIASYSAFRGALDLQPGQNTMIVQPSGSGFTRDIVAQTMEQIVITQSRRSLAGNDLATRITDAVRSVNRSQDLPLVYAAALEATGNALQRTVGAGSVAGYAYTEVTTGGSQRGAVRAAPAAGAAVWVEQFPNIRTTADSQGRYLLAGVPAGRVNIIVDDVKGTVSTHYKQRSPPVAVASSTTTPTEAPQLTTVVARNSISGYVRDDRTQEPIEGVRVTVWGQVSTTGSDGHYTVYNMPQGSWDVEYQILGYETKVHAVSFSTESAQEHSVTLRSLDKFPPIITDLQVVNIAADGTSAQINWVTNEPSSSQVEFGPTTAYGFMTQLADTNPRVKIHEVHLGPNYYYNSIALTLTPGTTYHFRVKSQDGAENLARSMDATFTTPDNAAPTVENLAADQVTTSTARIRWRTNEPATSEIEYGPGNYNETAGDAVNRVTSHTVLLTGLTPGTSYHVQVRSADQSNNRVPAGYYTTGFTTVTVTPPVVTNHEVPNTSLMATSATIVWSTDRLTTTELQYGTSNITYGSFASGAAGLSTTHTITLNGLTPNTLYHVRFLSRDSAGLAVPPESSTMSFGTPGHSYPSLTSGPVYDPLTQTSVTITWTTDRPTTTALEYGTNNVTYGMAATGSTSLSTSHSMTLSGLLPGTTYYLRLTSIDSNALMMTNNVHQFNTQGNVLPVVSNLAVNATATTAVVTWTTDEPATSELEFGVDQNYGTPVSGTAGLRTTHSVNVTGLTQNTRYHLRVLSRDEFGGLTQQGHAISFVTAIGAGPTFTSAGTSTSARPTWEWTAQDGVDIYFWRLDNPTVDTSSQYTWSTDWTPDTDLTEGRHKLYVRSRSAVDSSILSPTASFEIFVDLAPLTPEMSGASPTHSLRPTWYWRSGGLGSGTYRVRLDNPDLSAGTTEVVGTSWQPTTNLTDGMHTLYVQERDGGGQWSPTGSFEAEIGMWFGLYAGQIDEPGSADAATASANFNEPYGMAIDGSGNLYVADRANHAIRKITSAGQVSTVAGIPTVSGSLDGLPGAAKFNGPQAVALDAAGNIYVADTDNHTIRKIAASNGQTTTIAGQAGDPGSIDGAGTTARFNSPRGIAVDSSGNVYVADSGNHTIRKIAASDQNVTTIAGSAGNPGTLTGTGGAARFNAPCGLAFFANGDLLVADFGNSALRRVTPAGVTTNFAGLPGNQGFVDATGTTARFWNPTSVAATSDGGFVVGEASSRVRRVTSGAVVTLLGGNGENTTVIGVRSAAKFTQIWGIAANAAGQVFVAEASGQAGHVIRIGTYAE